MSHIGRIPLCERRCTTGDQPPETRIRSQYSVFPFCHLLSFVIAISKLLTPLIPLTFKGAAFICKSTPFRKVLPDKLSLISDRASRILTSAPALDNSRAGR